MQLIYCKFLKTEGTLSHIYEITLINKMELTQNLYVDN